VRVTGESAEDVRSAGENLALSLREELSNVRAELMEVNRVKNSVSLVLIYNFSTPYLIALVLI
jgi:hypothetical protein